MTRIHLTVLKLNRLNQRWHRQQNTKNKHIFSSICKRKKTVFWVFSFLFVEFKMYRKSESLMTTWIQIRELISTTRCEIGVLFPEEQTKTEQELVIQLTYIVVCQNYIFLRFTPEIFFFWKHFSFYKLMQCISSEVLLVISSLFLPVCIAEKAY